MSNETEQPLSPAVALSITQDKSWRVNLDSVLQEIKSAPKSRERSLTITKLQEAIMWLGMDLKELGTPTPYPNSYNPSNVIVDKTADGLKL
jgi:hypothetical protein